MTDTPDTLVERLRARYAGAEHGDRICLEAAGRIEALERRVAWQPIETAPTDGTRVLLMMPYGERIGAWCLWRDRSYPMLWQDDGGRALHRPWKFEDADEEAPTHWQPLPEPPTPGQLP